MPKQPLRSAGHEDQSIHGRDPMLFPPAAATALIAAMGYLDNLVQIGGVLAAVLLLALEAYPFNRLLGGLPYPIWRFDPNVETTYRSLSGESTMTTSRWQRLV